MPAPTFRRRLPVQGRDPVLPKQYRTFNGSTSSMQSAATIDLSAVNKVTVAWWMWWDAFAGDDDLAFEFSANHNNVTTGFLVDPNESGTNALSLSLKGDVGYSNAQYTRPSAAAWHHYAATYDKSATTNEVNLYIDAALQTPVSRLSNVNNTNNFAADTMYIMSRAGSTLFGAGRQARFAIWPGVVLAQADITALYTGVPVLRVQPTFNPYFWPVNGVSSPEPFKDQRRVLMSVTL